MWPSELSRKRTLAAVLVALFCLSMVSGVIKIPFLSIPDVHAQIVSTANIIYSINATSDSGCVITPTGNLIYAQGTWANFTCLAYPTYQIYNLAVNGSNLGPVSSYNFMPTGNTTLTLTSIATNSGTTGGSSTPTPTILEPNNSTAPNPTQAPLSKSAQNGIIIIFGILAIAVMLGVYATGEKKTLTDIFNDRTRRED